MSFSDEILAAYVDGELDAAARAEVEKAIGEDPSVERRIARYRDLRNRLRAAYAGELEEPVPDRLLAALRPPPSATPGESRAAPVDLQAVRAARAATAKGRGSMAAPRRRYALAASLLIAVGAGFFSWQHFRSAPIESLNGTLVARGVLAASLSNQLSGDDGSGVRIGLSFVSKSGHYCRTFSFAADAGLACRDAGRWEVRALAKIGPPTGIEPEFRTAGSDIPAKVLEAAEQAMSGEPLDRAGERAARGKNWSNPPMGTSSP